MIPDNDTQPQEPPKTREEYVRLAALQLSNTVEMIEDTQHKDLSIEEHIGVTSYALILGLRALTHATLALSAPPTEPPTPTEDGAALALLVALVSELRTYFDRLIQFPGAVMHEEGKEAFIAAQSYVRTQAVAKGDGNAQSL